jgi:hypothetical protein
MRPWPSTAASSTSRCAAAATPWPSSISATSSSPSPDPTDARTTDAHRHVGLVVDDQQAALNALDRAGIERQRNRVLDPWGNRLEIVGYPTVQFTKADHVLRAMNLAHLEKTDDAKNQLAAKGMAPA